MSAHVLLCPMQSMLFGALFIFGLGLQSGGMPDVGQTAPFVVLRDGRQDQVCRTTLAYHPRTTLAPPSHRSRAIFVPRGVPASSTTACIYSLNILTSFQLQVEVGAAIDVLGYITYTMCKGERGILFPSFFGIRFAARHSEVNKFTYVVAFARTTAMMDMITGRVPPSHQPTDLIFDYFSSYTTAHTPSGVHALPRADCSSGVLVLVLAISCYVVPDSRL